MRRILLYISVCLIFLFGSCKEETTAPKTDTISETVPANMFPLVSGHQFIYSGYLLDATGNKIAESEALYFSSWTIYNDTLLTTFFPPSSVISNAHQHGVLIIDSTSVPGYISPQRNIPFFAYYDDASGDYYYLTNFGYLFRSDSIFESPTSMNFRSDSLRFIKLASPSAKTNNKIVGTTEYFTSYLFGRSSPLNVKVDILINFEKKEDITLNVNGKDTTFTTYYLTISSHPTSGALDLGETISAKFWLAEGIGPVQIFLAGDKETPGSFRKLKAKNF